MPNLVKERYIYNTLDYEGQGTCIGYTLGSQCIPGIYARWFLITHEGVISKPPRVFPGIHGYLGYNQFVG